MLDELKEGSGQGHSEGMGGAWDRLEWWAGSDFTVIRRPVQ